MNHETLSRVTRITLLAALVLLALPALAGAHPACRDAAWIEPGEVVRGLGHTAGKPVCYRIATPDAGLLMLDVTVPAGTSAEPLLTLTAGSCGAGTGFGEAGKLGSLAATPSQRLVRVAGARDLLVCVGAQDPLLRLDDYRLETAFLARSKDEPIEVEPDGLAATGCGGWDKDEPIEVEPDGLALPPDVVAALCRETQRDDHGDLVACATRLELGRVVAGEIGNPWGDDQDVFAFELTAPGTVRLWISGEADPAAGLYDARGQRLALADDAGAISSAARRIKTLGRGIYIVRVQGWQGAEGAYELEVALLPRSW